MPQVKIGPEFFAKARNDYDYWEWAIIREFLQNSIDCGSRNIDITIEALGDDTLLTITNDGDAMTEEIITDKLLSLGSSGKGFRDGAVGGFGKAKEILYFCHVGYRIRSGNWAVDGRGGDYDINSVDEFFHGTESTVHIMGDYRHELTKQVKKFAAYGQWRGSMTLNGKQIDVNLHKGSRRREFDCGVIYTNRSMPNRFIVRMHGIPMFAQYISFDGTVVLELSHDSGDVLTSNRDGLKGRARQEINAFIQNLAADKKSALKATKATYTRYSGPKLLGVEGNGMTRMEAILAQVNDDGMQNGDPGEYTVAGLADAPRAELSHEFIIKNETAIKIHESFLPEGSMSKYATKLATIWAKLMMEMHKITGREGEFAVGFVFSSDCEAQHERGPYGTVYYLNPIKIAGKTSMKKRFKLTERGRLISIAAHEMVHGLGFQYHDENYAGRLTDLMGQIHGNTFGNCFK